MRDLALAPLLDAVVATGAHSLKIEGRMKSPLYVACVTDYYRRKLDGALTPDAERVLIQDLQTVFSRPWTSLYAGGADAAPDTVIDPVGIGHRGAPIGRAEALFRDRDGTSWLRFTTQRALEKHDGLQVELPEGGKPFGCAVHLLRAAGTQRTAISLPAGSAVEVALPTEDVPVIPRGAPVFCSASQAVRRRYEIQNLRESILPSGHPVDIRVRLAPEGLAVRAETAFEQTADVTSETILPLTLTPSRQPEQTAAAVRKAFERLGDTAWQLGALTLDDPHALYAPPSKLNEARRAVLAALTTEWEARRAARRASVTSGWTSEATSIAATPAPPVWTLKLRCDGPFLPAEALSGIDTLVLGIGHSPLPALEQQLAGWASLMGADHIRLALPLISREREIPLLKATLRTLTQRGWKDWECADLAGFHMLAACGVTPVSADWSLYALNRIAVAELARLGLRSYVLSPENSLDNIRALCGTGVPPVVSHRGTGVPPVVSHRGTGVPPVVMGETPMPLSPVPELLVYQHTPLFISETAPCLPHDDGPVTLTDRRGRDFVTQPLDSRWVTVSNTATCIAARISAAATNRLRVDLSWSPDSDISSVVRIVLSGHSPVAAMT
jgi:putative protease